MYMEKLSKYVNEMIIIISSSRQTLSQNCDCQNGGLLKVLDFWDDLEWTVGLRMYHLFGQDGG